MVALPLPDVEGSISEIRYSFDNLGALGVKVPTNSNGVYLGDSRLDKVFEELNSRNALDMLLTITDEKHILYGSDYPYVPKNLIIEKKETF